MVNLENLEFNFKIQKHWIIGITEFNGFFIVRKKQNNTFSDIESFVDNLEVVFIICLPLEDIQTAYKFKKILKVGKVVSDEKKCFYYVNSISHHYLRVCKYFNGMLLSKKRIEYERYRYVVYKIYNNEIENINYIDSYIDKYCGNNFYYLTLISKANELKFQLALNKKLFYHTYSIKLLVEQYLLRER